MFLLLSAVILDPSSVLAQLNIPFEYLTISSFNDSWGGSFTKTKDDQRSFGAIIDGQFETFNRPMQARATYSVLTNRFASPDSGRIDELEIYLRYPVWEYEDKITLNATAGSFFTGNLGGQQIQNKTHSSVGVNEIDLPYPASNKTFGFVGASLWAEKMLLWCGTESYFNLAGQAEYQLAFQYQQAFSLRGGLNVTNLRLDKIQFFAGFAQRDALYNNAALQSVANTESGFFLNYEMRLGIANFGFTVYPGQQFTSGYLGLTLLKAANNKKLEKINVTSEIGALGDDRGLFIRYLWNKAGADNNKWLFDAHYQFWTLGKKDVPDYPNVLANYQQFSLGVNYHFIKPKNTIQAIPSVSARAGVKQIRSYGGQEFAPTQSEYSFLLIGEAGLRIKFPTNILKKNCFYGVTPSYQVAQSFGGASETSFYFGFAGFVMVDF